MNALTRRLLWLGAGVMVATSTAAVIAQGRNDGTDGASLAALTSELRQLRMAVEELTKSQTQAQALGVYLSVQQGRILQVGTRLDSARKDLEAVSIRSREIASALSGTNDQLSQVTDPTRRAGLEQAVRDLKYEEATLRLQEQQARGRDAELSQALALEESRWSDLTARLEQLIKR